MKHKVVLWFVKTARYRTHRDWAIEELLWRECLDDNGDREDALTLLLIADREDALSLLSLKDNRRCSILPTTITTKIVCMHHSQLTFCGENDQAVGATGPTP